MPDPYIIDGDWGGDEMQLAAVLLAHPEKAKVLAASCVFGNTTLAQTVQNCASILSFLNASDLPVFAGAAAPSDHEVGEGDNAHGADGMGGIALPHASRKAEALPATDLLLQIASELAPQTLTLTATGPLTNIAEALRKDAATFLRVKRVLIMGGCTECLPAKDMPFREGNITPEAEFNFHCAAKDAQDVFESDLSLVLFPMNCTQQLSLTEEREDRLRQNLGSKGEIIADLMAAPREMDFKKFGAPPFMHDVHTALYALWPELYEGQRGEVTLAPDGHTTFQAAEGGKHLVIEKIADSDLLFERVFESFRKCV